MITWRKSSHSGSGAAGGQDCVEVARLSRAIGVRDSKAPDAGHLAISADGFARLLGRVKRDEIGR